MKDKSRKKTKAAAPKKSAKPKSKDSSAPKHLPVSTFDAWISKQVRASNRGSFAGKEAPSSESTKLPESTFDAWMKKQKPKENSVSKPQSNGSPNTFDVWINKRVAEWKETPDKIVEEEISITSSSAE